MRIVISLAIGLVFGLTAAQAGAAAKPPAKPAPQKGPPACAAIRFRAVPSGAGDGEQPAGLYKSRFGRLELTATVKGGAATDYHLSFDGKPLGASPQALPSTASACAAKKKMPAPGQPVSACTGDSFTVVIDHEAKERLALLYGLQGKQWQFCSAGGF
jgi:hypothetical protein